MSDIPCAGCGSGRFRTSNGYCVKCAAWVSPAPAKEEPAMLKPALAPGETLVIDAPPAEQIDPATILQRIVRPLDENMQHASPETWAAFQSMGWRDRKEFVARLRFVQYLRSTGRLTDFDAAA